MCQYLGLSKGKLDGNLNVMRLVLKQPTRPRVSKAVIAEGYFDVDEYFLKNII
jgi:hypothetical protein